MSTIALLTSGLSLLIWLHLWLGRGHYWKTVQPLPSGPAAGEGCRRPSVGVVIPARNEADLLPQTLPTVLEQEYPGPFHVFLVDDHSRDGTGEVARQIARTLNLEERLTVVEAEPLAAGWTGKLWALEQGVRAGRGIDAEFLLFTDADIAHARDTLRRLTEKASSDQADLVSLMALLRVETFWERLLIPAFVYFFAMIYPFRWVNDPRRTIAAAAGGCVLVRSKALERSGGLASIAGELIDDCSLAGQIKKKGRPEGGRIWLGLSREVKSLRPYDGLGEIWKMVARTAYVQLNRSPLLLSATVAGMGLVYLGPPLAFWGGVAGALLHPGALPWWGAALAGLAGWTVMIRTYLPMVKWFRASPSFAPFLPLTAALYTLMTLDSARRFRRGGGSWKGRIYDAAVSGQRAEPGA